MPTFNGKYYKLRITKAMVEYRCPLTGMYIGPHTYYFKVEKVSKEKSKNPRYTHTYSTYETYKIHIKIFQHMSVTEVINTIERIITVYGSMEEMVKEETYYFNFANHILTLLKSYMEKEYPAESDKIFYYPEEKAFKTADELIIGVHPYDSHKIIVNRYLDIEILKSIVDFLQGEVS
jgi:hypothetical protein